MDLLKELGMHAGASPIIFKKAELLRNNMTKAELKLWSFLRMKPYSYKFRRQHPFGVYILDFYCHSKRLSIEVDGINHNHKQQKFHDKQRTKFIVELGIKELRFTNEDVLLNMQRVKDHILEHLRK